MVEQLSCVWPYGWEDDVVDEGGQEGVWSESEYKEKLELREGVDGDGVVVERKSDAIEGSADEERRGREERVGEDGFEKLFGKGSETRH